MEPTGPVRAELVLANFDEVFALAPESRPTATRPVAWGLWQKAGLMFDQDAYVLVAPAIPSNLHALGGAWRTPTHHAVPERCTGRLCDDLLADRPLFSRLVDEFRGLTPIRIGTQVYSPSVERVVDALEVAGVSVDRSGLPRVSGQTVRYWNTKLGGRDLLLSVPEVRRALPAAVTCTTAAEAAALVVSRAPAQGTVVKADTGSGGNGIWFFGPGSRLNAPAVARSILKPARQIGDVLGDPDQRRRVPSSRRTGKHKAKGATLDHAGPYLVEEMVGTPTTNVSPTADFLVGERGQVTPLGAARQLLEGGASYAGSSGPLPASHAPIERCIELGSTIGAHLSRRGYRGLLNVDFVLTDRDEPYIAELNVRQSAPLDQFLVMRRLLGNDWAKHAAYVCEEAVPFHLPHHTWTVEDVAAWLKPRLALTGGEMSIPLAIYRDEHESGSRHRHPRSIPPVECEVSLLSVAADPIAADRLAARARAALADA